LEVIGEVMHLAKSGRLIIRLYQGIRNIQSGQLLVDEHGKSIGKVIELIGPVAAPYVSSLPSTDRANRIVGSMVYVREASPSLNKRNIKFNRGKRRYLHAKGKADYFRSKADKRK